MSNQSQEATITAEEAVRITDLLYVVKVLKDWYLTDNVSYGSNCHIEDIIHSMKDEVNQQRAAMTVLLLQEFQKIEKAYGPGRIKYVILSIVNPTLQDTEDSFPNLYDIGSELELSPEQLQAAKNVLNTLCLRLDKVYAKEGTEFFNSYWRSLSGPLPIEEILFRSPSLESKIQSSNAHSQEKVITSLDLEQEAQMRQEFMDTIPELQPDQDQPLATPRCSFWSNAKKSLAVVGAGTLVTLLCIDGVKNDWEASKQAIEGIKDHLGAVVGGAGGGLVALLVIYLLYRYCRANSANVPSAEVYKRHQDLQEEQRIEI
jgi:hypothetical protein